MTTKTQYLVIGRGKAGWHADGEYRYSDGTLHTMSSSGGTLEGYVKDAVEGAIVYDADKADDNAFVSHVISGPMLKTQLPAGQTERFDENEKYSGLDYVATDVYVALLRRIPGIRIGQVVGGKVVWEGQTELFGGGK